MAESKAKNAKDAKAVEKGKAATNAKPGDLVVVKT